MNLLPVVFDSLTCPRLELLQSEQSLIPPNSRQSAGLKSDRYLVEMVGVNLHFGRKMIFDDFDLEIAQGERSVLLGPSGIGKSTLLRLLLGTLQPESGRILFNGGRRVATAPPNGSRPASVMSLSREPGHEIAFSAWNALRKEGYVSLG